MSVLPHAGAFLHRRLTRAQLDALGFTRDSLRARDAEGRSPDAQRAAWRPSGKPITSPVHLWEVEQARDDVRAVHELGRGVPVHLLLWSVLEPALPFLTRLGGTPWRPAGLPWPKNENGEPCTFLGQFCFVDSRAITPELPDDVMLVFLPTWNDCLGGERLVVEWHPRHLDRPMRADDVPSQPLPVPRYSGVIYETTDHPDDVAAFEAVLGGHTSSRLVATTQASKIGRTAFEIQGSPAQPDEQLFCCLNSVWPADHALFHPATGGKPARLTARWPLLDLERYATEQEPPDIDGFSTEMLLFGDLGALYFLVDRRGRVRSTGAGY